MTHETLRFLNMLQRADELCILRNRALILFSERNPYDSVHLPQREEPQESERGSSARLA